MLVRTREQHIIFVTAEEQHIIFVTTRNNALSL